jgi:hypothetical protein
MCLGAIEKVSAQYVRENLTNDVIEDLKTCK